MTEAGWRLNKDVTRLLNHLKGGEGERKLRLFVCACCRLFWDSLPDDRCRRAIEVNEGYADGLSSPSELRQARVEAYRARAGRTETERLNDGRVVEHCSSVVFRATAVSKSILRDAVISLNSRTRSGDVAPAADLFRDIFGNPFRPVTVDPRWLTTPVLDLARTMYESRDFAAMPILADALEEAGCDNDDVLAHCRGGGPHVRGCWVVDLILGKA